LFQCIKCNERITPAGQLTVFSESAAQSCGGFGLPGEEPASMEKSGQVTEKMQE
jgi:hypothetical protein